MVGTMEGGREEGMEGEREDTYYHEVGKTQMSL